MKFAKYLEEERISSSVKRSLLGLIKHPKKNTVISGEDEIFVVPSPPAGVTFTFNKDLYELSMTITDLVDKIGGYKIKSSKKDNKTMLTITPE